MDDHRPRAGGKPIIDATERMSGDWEPAQVVVAPDGGIAPIPVARLTVLDDDRWICLRGPCRHYHRFVATIDAQEPLPVRAEDGSLQSNTGPEDRHTVTIHTCYPHAGIEMPLNDQVVYECNRWDPIAPAMTEADADRERRREAYRRYEEADGDELTAMADGATVPRRRFFRATSRDGAVQFFLVASGMELAKDLVRDDPIFRQNLVLPGWDWIELSLEAAEQIQVAPDGYLRLTDAAAARGELLIMLSDLELGQYVTDPH